jgi:opacity protein-like surface antigen
VTTSKSLLALAALAAAMTAAPTAAHHSFAMFDQNKSVTLKGQVAEFQWTNPHAFIELNVPNGKGGSDRWSIELNSPNNLTRQGWRRSTLKPGDTVSITLNPLRNGKKGGLFNKVVLPNGTVLGDGRPAGSDGKAINVPTAN